MLNLKTGKQFDGKSAREQLTRRDFGRGLAAIIGAGVAPSIALGLAGSANAGVGRWMMRNVGARNAAMFGGEKPYDYEVNYLIGDGSSYIPIGVNSSIRVGFDADIKTGSYFNRENPALVSFCQGSEYSQNWGCIFDVRSTGYNVVVGNSSWYFPYPRFSIISKSANVKYNFLHSSETIFDIEGESLRTYGVPTNSNMYSSEIYMFAGCSNGVVVPTYIANYGIGSCKISINSSVVRDFIPVVKDSVGYMYDRCGSICPLTGNSLYANAGTGAFTWE